MGANSVRYKWEKGSDKKFRPRPMTQAEEREDDARLYVMKGIHWTAPADLRVREMPRRP